MIAFKLSDLHATTTANGAILFVLSVEFLLFVSVAKKP